MMYRLIFYIFICLTLVTSCKSLKQDDIVYVFRKEIESRLVELKNNFHSDDIYFDLRKKNDLYYLYICNLDNYYRLKTNRKVLVKGKFYPLLFETDFYFATTEKPKEVLRRLEEDKRKGNNAILRKSELILNHTEPIVFDIHEKILESNY